LRPRRLRCTAPLGVCPSPRGHHGTAPRRPSPRQAACRQPVQPRVQVTLSLPAASSYFGYSARACVPSVTASPLPCCADTARASHLAPRMHDYKNPSPMPFVHPIAGRLRSDESPPWFPYFSYHGRQQKPPHGLPFLISRS
jgi:hypothetical protein